jgi:hypothetical protein
VSAVASENISTYYWVIGYGLIHGISIIFAPLCFLIKKEYFNNKLLAFIWLLVIILLLYIVYLSNASTAFIISIFSLLSGLFINYSDFSRKNFFKTLTFITTLILLFNKTTIIVFLDSIQPLFNEMGGNYAKIGDIKDYFIYGEADGGIIARESLYNLSIKEFLKSPIFGTNSPEKIGLHSYFLDRLAALGLFFIIPLFLMFASHIKSIYKILNKTKVVYSISCFSYLLMLSLKNEFGTGAFLIYFAILPIFCIYIDEKLTYKQKNNNES